VAASKITNVLTNNSATNPRVQQTSKGRNKKALTDVDTVFAMMDLNILHENKFSKNLLQCRKTAAKIDQRKGTTPTLAEVMSMKDKHVDPLTY